MDDHLLVGLHLCHITSIFEQWIEQCAMRCLKFAHLKLVIETAWLIIGERGGAEYTFK